MSALFLLQGAHLVYRRFLLPALRQHQPAIDRYIEMGDYSVRKQMSQLVCIFVANESMILSCSSMTAAVGRGQTDVYA